jgi:transposase
MDKEETILCQNQHIDTTPQALQSFFSTIQKGKVAIESTTIWEHIYETLTTLGLEVTLVNPLKIRTIAETKIKTDKIDAQILAHLLRSDFLPTSYLPLPDIRDLRDSIRQRAYLVNSAQN